MSMEDLVNKLAELQADRKVEEDAANSDRIICKFELEIKEMESALATLIQARDECKSPYIEQVAKINIKADELKAQIIDTWDGEKRTVRYGAGLLKFRTTQSLVIENETLVLTGLLDHTSVKDVAMNYIKGFNLTAVKKYMGVLSLPMGAAYIKHNTTVKLEVE